MELKTVKEIVKTFLINDERARGDDDYLYACVLCRFLDKPLCEVSLKDFFLNRKKWGIPSFESVRRARQKVQEENQALKPADNIQNGRAKAEEKFYDFAKE